MLDNNTNKVTWVAVAVGIVALLGIGFRVLMPQAFDTATAPISKMVTGFVSPATSYQKGQDIDGVSKDDVTDKSKIVDTGIDSKAVKIRTSTWGESAVWIGVTENGSGGYTISGSGTTSKLSDPTSISGGSLVIPNSIEGRSITKIDSGVFENASFVGNLTLPRDLQYVGERAFKHSNFNGNLVLPTQMWGIQNSAFENSTFNGNLVLPKGLSIIGSYSFKNANFNGSLVLPDTTSIINEGAFLNSHFSGHLTLPSHLTRISHYALMNSDFSGDLIMPDSVEFFGGQVFNKSHFTGELHISNSLTSMYVNNFTNGSTFNSNFSKVTGGKNLQKLLKIQESSSDKETDLSNASGISVNGVEYKDAKLLLQNK